MCPKRSEDIQLLNSHRLKLLLETAALSVEDAVIAEAGGADRIEVCASRIEGAITPSGGLIKAICRSVSIDVHVMIRPRGGNFFYSPGEIETMIEDIELARNMDAEGVLFGVLNEDSTLNLPTMKQLISTAKGLEVSCHRAFDLTPNPFRAMEELIDLGVDRILTSGQAPLCIDGRRLIAQLVEKADDRIAIVPGGGITLAHLDLIVKETHAREYHLVDIFTAVSPQVQDVSQPKIHLGTSINLPDNILYRLSLNGVQQARNILSKYSSN